MTHPMKNVKPTTENRSMMALPLAHSRLSVVGLTLAVAVLCVVFCAPGAQAASVTLTWQDNSTNETVFRIERKTEACSASALPFAEIATVPANVMTYKDIGLAEGATVCYRVAASNSAGKSGYSNTAGIAIPFPVPIAPSLLGVVGEP